MNSLLAKYRDEIQSILGKYPPDQKRAAVMPMLYLAQQESGYVSRTDLQEIGEILEISSTDVGSIVGFYTLYHDHPEGEHRVQVCNDLPCALRGADQYLDQLCENLGIQVGGTTEDGLVSVEAVMCLAACDKAPMFQVQDSAGIRYYENQTVETTLQLIEHWRSKGATPAPQPAGQLVQPVGSTPPSPVEAPEAVQLPEAPEEPEPVSAAGPAEPAQPAENPVSSADEQVLPDGTGEAEA